MNWGKIKNSIIVLYAPVGPTYLVIRKWKPYQTSQTCKSATERPTITLKKLQSSGAESRIKVQQSSMSRALHNIWGWHKRSHDFKRTMWKPRKNDETASEFFCKALCIAWFIFKCKIFVYPYKILWQYQGTVIESYGNAMVFLYIP